MCNMPKEKATAGGSYHRLYLFAFTLLADLRSCDMSLVYCRLNGKAESREREQPATTKGSFGPLNQVDIDQQTA